MSTRRRWWEAVPQHPHGPPELGVLHERDPFEELLSAPLDVPSLRGDPCLLFHSPASGNQGESAQNTPQGKL